LPQLESTSDLRAVLSLTPPVRVCVARCDSLGQEESLGSGTLVDKIEVGSRVQISLSGNTLRTSPITEVREIGRGSLEIITANRTYRITRDAGARPELAEATRQRLDQLRAMTRKGPRPPGRAATGMTSSGQVSTPAKPGGGSFSSGSEVMVTRVRTADALLEACGALGKAKLLDDLRVGASARFALDDGSTIATSPVRSLERTGATRVQFSTGNSIYRFDLLQ